MSNVTIILIVLAFLLIYNLLLHLVDRRLYIEKQKVLRLIFEELVMHADIIEDKTQLLNFLVTVEKDINNII